MSKPPSPPEARSHQELARLQRLMAEALFSPLNAGWGMRRKARDGRSMETVAASFIKPNDRLTSFERLEIYNRQYWFRLLDCLYDDYPGVRGILGERRFMKLAKAYLSRHPSRSYSLRDLGDRLEQFLREISQEPGWTGRHPELLLMARDMARFEWAQIVAFDAASAPAITPDDILNVPPSDLRFNLQPYLSLLSLDYAVDEFSTALRDDEALRSEASHAIDSQPGSNPQQSRRSLPKREKIRLAVHRCDNLIYFKRLEPEAFRILRSLQRGLSLEEACGKAIASSRRKNVDWAEEIRECFACWASLGWLTPATEPPCPARAASPAQAVRAVQADP